MQILKETEKSLLGYSYQLVQISVANYGKEKYGKAYQVITLKNSEEHDYTRPTEVKEDAEKSFDRMRIKLDVI